MGPRGLEIPLWKRHAVGAYIWQLRMPQHEVAKRLNLTRQSIGLMIKRAKVETNNSDDLPTLMQAISGKHETNPGRPAGVKPKQGRPRKQPLEVPGTGAALAAEEAVQGEFDCRISEAVNHHFSDGQESGGSGSG